MKNKLNIFTFVLIFSISGYGASYQYVENHFIHLHKNKSINSLTLITLSCGEKVLVKESSKPWLKVVSGSFLGFALSKNFSKEKPNCFSSNHPKIYNELDLSMREIYKYGRLEDLFVHGEVSL